MVLLPWAVLDTVHDYLRVLCKPMYSPRIWLSVKRNCPCAWLLWIESFYVPSCVMVQALWFSTLRGSSGNIGTLRDLRLNNFKRLCMDPPIVWHRSESFGPVYSLPVMSSLSEYIYIYNYILYNNNYIHISSLSHYTLPQDRHYSLR